ncbi:MAG: hypothetical protein LBQ60_12110 [Bacteroidales bacterium]|nr:hypothetical protein [Bacteroidales bacterium]
MAAIWTGMKHYLFISSRFSIVVLTCFLLFSCRSEYDLVYEKRLDKEVEDARQWIMERYPEQFSIRSATSPNTMFVKPDWNRAFTRSNSKIKTVETPVFPMSGWVYCIVDEENKKKYEETGDNRYIANFSRLVVITNLGSGEIISCIMTIMPSAKYLEQTDFSPYKEVVYIDKKDFDGRIVFYHMNGEFSNGYVYENGKIIRKIRKKQPETNDPEQSIIEHSPKEQSL